MLFTACGDDARMPTEIAPLGNSRATFSRITPGSAIAGAPTPFGATITEADRQLVRDWVARGAPPD